MENKRIALVTGANKGIGFHIARQLVEAGVHVILGARDSAKGAAAVKAIGLSCESLVLDVDNAASLTAAAEAIALAHGRLDILVNNAGIFDFADGPPETASIAAVRRVMETNFFGPIALTQAVLPLLRKSPAPRVVNLSSSLGSLTLNGDAASPYFSQQFIGYNASKAALNMLTVQLSAMGITANSVSPGFVKTDLTGYGVMTPDEGARLPVCHALAGAATGGFFEPDGVTPW